MRTVFGLDDPLSVMSPVHIPRGFTKAYIAGEVVEDLSARIRRAHASLMDRDLVLIEGTGHAGVGAVIDLSNAAVASMLGAPAVIVSEGGVGRPIDEIVLNAALFERHGVAGRGRDREQGRLRGAARHHGRAGAGARAPRDPAARRAAVPADPVEPDARDDRRGSRRRGDLPGTGPGHGHRRGRDRRDAARAHAPLGRPGDAGHRPRRSRGCDPGDHRRARGSPRPVGARARADRRLSTVAGRDRRDPRRGPLLDARLRGHVPRRLGRPRSAREDPRLGRREDRADQARRRGAHRRGPDPGGRRGGRARRAVAAGP